MVEVGLLNGKSRPWEWPTQPRQCTGIPWFLCEMAERIQTLSDGFERDGLGNERGRAGVLVGWAELSRNLGRLSLVLGYDGGASG